MNRTGWIRSYSNVGVCLAALACLLACVSTAQAQVKISQVYGAGGNTQAPTTNDYIEIYNMGAPQLLTGWSVQYASAAGLFTVAGQVTALPAITLGTGQYLLVQEAIGATVVAGQAPGLPASDAVPGTIAMSATDFKVALVSSTVAIPTALGQPTYALVPTLVDFVGCGTANWNDSAAAGGANSSANNAPPASVAHALYRIGCGATDSCPTTGACVSRADWAAGFPAPRNTLTALNAGITLIGTALPLTVEELQTVRLTATPYRCATNNLGAGTTVSVNTTLIGGGGVVAMLDGGVAPDEVAGDGIYTALVTVAAGTTTGTKSLPVTVSDGGGNSGGSYIGIEVKAAATTPNNDNCTGATALAIPSSTTSTFTGATVESNSFASFGAAPTTGMTSRRGFWYTVVGNGNTLTASLCATAPALDSVMAVFCGTCDGLTVIATGDDAGPACAGTAASARWCSALGTTYYIWIAPFATGVSAAAFTLDITDGAACATAFPCTMCLGVAGPYTETEPGYGIHTNDGCGSTPNLFTTIASPTAALTVVRGTARGMIGNRDIDSYRFQAASTGVLTMTIDTLGTNAQAQLVSLAAGGVCPQSASIVNTPIFVARCVTTIQTASANVTSGTWYAVQVVGGIGIQVTPASTVFGGQMPGGTTYQYALTLSIASSGACCLQDGTCQVLTPAACAAQPFASYRGDNTTCPPTPACDAAGACCLASGACVELNSNAACLAQGGCWQGPGASCQKEYREWGGGGTPAAIPDANTTGVTLSLSVPESYTISDLNVMFVFANPTHSWYGDINMRLKHVDTGTTVLLLDGTGVGDSSDLCGPYALDDSAAITLDTAAANEATGTACILTGTYRPDNPLSAFNGQNINGTWTLQVWDDAVGDTGALQFWSLIAPKAPCPRIVTDPVSLTVCPGGSASFTVVAGGANLTYQWYKGVNPLSNGGNISGAQSATLTINPVGLGDAGSYSVVVTSGNCSKTSVTVTLTVPNCDDNNACTDDFCNPATGQCEHTPHNCDDGNPCTDDGCDPMTGCYHTPHDCNDNLACTVDTCDPLIGCVHTPVDCDDGNACTRDVCIPATGECLHSPNDCDDLDPCTDDSCDPMTGCVHTPHDCDDGDPCTVDTCGGPLRGGNPCVVPNNGGTATLPPAGCQYLSPDDVHRIIDGLPAGTTIELAPIHRDFICNRGPGGNGVCSFQQLVDCDEAGGSLGGEKECSDSQLQFALHGTGMLAGFDRTVSIPISFETHTAPRTPGQPVQSFDTDMFRLFGQINNIGDPDFDLLRIVGGTDFGMPSPGHTTLRQAGNNWAVDSFFDIEYRIDFVGAPGGPLAGHSGSTTATIRMATGNGDPCVHTPVDCDDQNACTDDSCDPKTGECVHTPVDCDDGDPCTDDGCDPVSGCYHTPHDCNDNNACTNDSCDPLTGCVHTPVDCNDNNACTNDSCDPKTGECVHTAVDCDDGNACTDDGCDPLTGCTHTPHDCNDGDPCTDDGCDPMTGCTHTPHDCNDGDPCTIDSCSLAAGGCVHTPVDCNDNNACTNDSCDPKTGGCVHTAVDCDDDNACTDDFCDALTGCYHTPHNCDDGNPCTVDTCDPLTGCIHTPLDCDDGDPCTVDTCVGQRGGGNPCIVPDNGGGTVTLPPAGCEYLSPAEVHKILDGLPVTNPPTTIELAPIHRDFICHVPGGGGQGVCSFQQLVDCDEAGGGLGGEKECSESQLNFALHGTGSLAGFDRTVNIPVSFETHTGPRTPGAPVQKFQTDMFRLFGQINNIGDPDFDLLRIVAGTDFGLPSPGHTTLVQLPGNNWAVDSFFDITYRIDFVGRPGGALSGMSGSTTATIRMATGEGIGHCVHTPVDCDDNNACTDDSCDPATGACVHTPHDCNDGNPCTDDGCDPVSGCYHTPHDCNDNDPCTVDTCDPLTGCVHTPVDCDDHNACTIDECDPLTGRCVHTPVDCDDQDACTDDGCDPMTGCYHTPHDCNDGDPCTTDTCDPMSGCHHAPVDCDDHNACTNDSCDPKTGQCIHTPVDCDDHDACTDDGCDPMTGCTHTPHDCNDNDPCTTDTCDPLTGCVHTPVVCNDSNACTNDSCDPKTGQCVHTPVDCDDHDACTDDGCDPVSGCYHTPHDCNDNDPCTTDTCDPMSGCIHTPVDCDDGLYCTIDSCDPVTGQCVHTPRDCSDGDPCTTDSCDEVRDICVNTPLPNSLAYTVQLAGANFPASLSRCIRFELAPVGCGPLVTVNTQATFLSGTATGVVAIPCGNYTCVMASDPLHTLRRAINSPPLSGLQYTVNFTGAKALLGGNVDDSPFIDITDFGYWAANYLVNYGTGNTLCGASPPHPDFSGNGKVFTEDFTFVQINYYQASEYCCTPNLVGPDGQPLRPITDISVAELRRMGLGRLAAGDVNRDGRLNQQDVIAVMQGARPRPVPVSVGATGGSLDGGPVSIGGGNP